MTTHLVTFATEDMSCSAELCHLSALRNGVDGEVFKYSPYDVTRLQYYPEHRELFDAPRGCGYWAFKPALIHRVIDQDCFIRNINDGDVVIYADAGVEFINNVSHIIDRMDQDIFLFANMWEHAHWCKRDIIDAVWPLEGYSVDKADPNWQLFDCWVPWSATKRFGKQVQASVIFFRVSDYSRKFVKEWLDWCLFECGRLIDDSPSRTQNHPEFRENRHDQAILTTLAYRDGLRLHAWPAQYNDGAFEYPRDGYTDTYPCLFHHHRRRNHEWEQVA